MRGFVIALLLIGADACTKTSTEKSLPSRADKVVQLSIFMQQRYRRELEKDGFEMNYIPKPPNTILISIQYKPSASRSLISTLIDSAKEIIQHKGAELYQLDHVNVESEIKEI